MSKPQLVVVGNGMVGMRTVDELLKLAPGLRHQRLRQGTLPQQ